MEGGGGANISKSMDFAVLGIQPNFNFLIRKTYVCVQIK